MRASALVAVTRSQCPAARGVTTEPSRTRRASDSCFSSIARSWSRFASSSRRTRTSSVSPPPSRDFGTIGVGLARMLGSRRNAGNSTGSSSRRLGFPMGSNSKETRSSSTCLRSAWRSAEQAGASSIPERRWLPHEARESSTCHSRAIGTCFTGPRSGRTRCLTKALQLTPNSWPRSGRGGILAATAQPQRWRQRCLAQLSADPLYGGRDAITVSDGPHPLHTTRRDGASRHKGRLRGAVG